MGTVDELFAAVYAEPDADAPRQVLADFLQQAGDARGEFIALQMARAAGRKPTAAQTRRERALLAKHEQAWRAPLASGNPARCVWERGFVGELTAHDPPRTAADVAAWSTVRTLKIVGMIDRAPGLLSSSHLRALTTIEGLTPRGLALLSRARPRPPLEAMELFSFAEALRPADRRELTKQLDGFARLTRLSLNLSLRRWSASALAWLWSSAFARRLRQLRLDMDPPLDVAGCLGAVVAQLPTLDELSVGNAYFRFCFTRDAAGRLRALRVIWSNLVRARSYLAWVVEGLRQLPERSLTSFELVLGDTRFSPDALAPLRKVVAARLTHD